MLVIGGGFKRYICRTCSHRWGDFETLDHRKLIKLFKINYFNLDNFNLLLWFDSPNSYKIFSNVFCVIGSKKCCLSNANCYIETSLKYFNWKKLPRNNPFFFFETLFTFWMGNWGNGSKFQIIQEFSYLNYCI